MKYHSVFITRRNSETGELQLDSFVSYNNDEEEKMITAARIKDNELWKVTSKEALDMAKCKRNLGETFRVMGIRARSNLAYMHHFITDFKLTEEDCAMYVKFANKDKAAMKKLKEARV